MAFSSGGNLNPWRVEGFNRSPLNPFLGLEQCGTPQTLQIANRQAGARMRCFVNPLLATVAFRADNSAMRWFVHFWIPRMAG